MLHYPGQSCFHPVISLINFIFLCVIDCCISAKVNKKEQWWTLSPQASHSWPPTERTIRTTIPGQEPEAGSLPITLFCQCSIIGQLFFKAASIVPVFQSVYIHSACLLLKRSCAEMSTGNKKTHQKSILHIIIFICSLGVILYVLWVIYNLSEMKRSSTRYNLYLLLCKLDSRSSLNIGRYSFWFVTP